MIIKFVLAAAMLSLPLARAAAQDNQTPVRIGVLDEMSSMLADQQGEGDVIAAKMAVEDFGGKVLGRPIEVLSGDAQSKPDIGATIARNWYDRDGVQMILGGATSAVALAVQTITQTKNRIQINTSAGTSELTGKACSPNSAHWVFDTYALANVTAKDALRRGLDSWYFIGVDYAFGHALVSDAGNMVIQGGGKIVGTVFYPSGASDFSSYVVTAAGSKAKVVAFANSGAELVNAIKQATEFGLVANGQEIVALLAFTSNIKDAGLATTQGLVFDEAFYWDQNNATRGFTARFAPRFRNRPPTSLQAGAYSATLHYLKSVQAAGTLQADKVMQQMRAIPVNDFMTNNAHLREDGRLMRDMYVLQAKRPAESKGEWDLLKVVGVVPGSEAFRPLAESECPLVQKAR
jgi:branched-chain amino acid transport system substrate-binding protein